MSPRTIARNFTKLFGNLPKPRCNSRFEALVALSLR
jgi:hypothetical protein